MDTTKFLLECISTLPNVEEVSKQLSGLKKKEKIEEDASKKELPNDQNTVTISCIQPRGKMNFSFWGNKLQLNSPNQKTKLEIHSGQVEHMLVFPNPQECKVHHLKKKSTNKLNQITLKNNSNPMGSILLIMLKNNADTRKSNQSTNKPLTQISLVARPDCDWIYKEICDSISFPYEKIVRIYPPSQKLLAKEHNVFWSDNTNNINNSNIPSLPFVSCYLNVNDGYLFPLLQGLLFHKPPIFIPKEKLKSIACGRGGGSGSTRFVDMKIELHDNHSVKQAKNNFLEFTNIPREELTVLNKYIHKTLIPSMMNDDNTYNNTDETDDNDDSDVSLSTKKSEEIVPPPTKRMRSKRSSAIEARQITKAQINNIPESDDEDSDGLDYEQNAIYSDESVVSANSLTESEDENSL